MPDLGIGEVLGALFAGGAADAGAAAGTAALGANNWSTATTLPAAAGAGGAASTLNGGNAGLVILSYDTPTGTCSL